MCQAWLFVPLLVYNGLVLESGEANCSVAQADFSRFAMEHKNAISLSVPAFSSVGMFAHLVAAKGNTNATKAMLALAYTSRELS